VLTNEEKRLKEAIKILIRDGKSGKFFEAAKSRYSELKNSERIINLSGELPGIDWTENYRENIASIEAMIK